jgi:hypothetical protein
MNTPYDDPDDDRPQHGDEERGLGTIERPADDPQSRPALDPEVGLAERHIPEDT